MALLIFYVVLALGVSFFCSIMEAVLLSVSPSFVAQMQQRGPIGRKLRALKDDVDRPLAAILSLNTIAHTVGEISAHPIITDSGGYQVFSLPNVQVDDAGVRFRMEKGGQPVELTPEKAIAIQQKLGADVMMAFDECVSYPAPYEAAKTAMERTVGWARRCRESWTNPEQALFGIVQGSTYPDLRRECAERIAELELSGIAVGGLSVGEGLDTMREVLAFTVPHLPEDRPRYLMGVGLPEDILAAVELGIDMSDCVIPTKYARTGVIFTQVGRLRVMNNDYRKDRFPPDTACRCYTCENYTRAYLHHLFHAGEIFGQTLATIHNIAFYMNLMADIRQAIRGDRFPAFKAEFLERYLREGKKRRRVG